MAEYYGIGYLKRKLATKVTRVKRRYKYYEMKNQVRDFDISTPPKLRNFKSVLGWCAKAVDSMADRLIFREFSNDNFGLNEIFQMNNMDVLMDSAITGALISSCDFIYIGWDEERFPRLTVIDGANATGIIDRQTNMLKEGYAVLDRDEYGKVTLEAYMIAGRTDIYEDGKRTQTLTHSAPYPLLVPIIYRPDAVRPFGHSRISRACMSIVGSAARTIKRSEISAEFYSFPQKYLIGMSEDAEAMDKWRASMSSLLMITKDEDGDTPTAGQFSQQSQSPHTEQLREFAALFAGETGLTLDDLGFVSDNPSSADAIKASHESLRLAARKAQRSFGTGFLNTGYLAACIRDNFPYRRQQLYLTTPKWEPIFTPDAAMLSGIGDGVIKINQAIPGYIGGDAVRDLTGISADPNMQNGAADIASPAGDGENGE